MERFGNFNKKMWFYRIFFLCFFILWMDDEPEGLPNDVGTNYNNLFSFNDDSTKVAFAAAHLWWMIFICLCFFLLSFCCLMCVSPVENNTDVIIISKLTSVLFHSPFYFIHKFVFEEKKINENVFRCILCFTVKIFKK